MKPKNKKIWRWIGILSLLISGFWMILDNPRQENFITGLLIGEGSVLVIWGLKEMFMELIYKTKK
jgi:uncharacterized membrane protein